MSPIEVVGVVEDEASAVQPVTASGNAVDLVIVDIFLKRVSGLGVLRRKCTELGASKVFDKSNELDASMLYCERLASGEAGNSLRGRLI